MALRNPADAQLLKRSRNKYRAQRCEMDGHKFDSRAEMRRYAELRLLERAGQIAALCVHPKFRLAINGVKICDYIADFAYVALDKPYSVVEDVKSPPTARLASFRIKKKLMLALHGINVRVILAK